MSLLVLHDGIDMRVLKFIATVASETKACFQKEMIYVLVEDSWTIKKKAFEAAV